MSEFAVFDLETSGFNYGTAPDCDVVTEIAWCICRGGEADPPHSFLIRTGKSVPEEVVAITGITTEMLATEGVPLRLALDTFLADTEGLPLIGHNVSRFDAPFLEAACKSVGLTPPDHSRYIDTAALFKARKLGIQSATFSSHWQFAEHVLNVRSYGLKYNLGHCCDTLGIDRSDVVQHRAGADCVLTHRLYTALTEKVAV